MTTEVLPGELRVRRPKDKEELILQLLVPPEGEGLFGTRAEVLVFAAALGWSRNSRVELKEFAEPIRFEVFRKMPTVEAFIEGLAVMAEPGNPEILSDARASDRLRIFEEYANGGLAVIRGELNTTRATAADALIDLVRDASEANRDKASKVPADIRKILSRPDWS
ncbi:DNA phosphorothioation-associated protein 4 [Streptomyces flavalbus]|uniref:DNA phosphorothioation-associated protein 4 n=1 Tax=Streptomyces flavalbus TaxID=2665155 RepID=A0ABW2W802_9ACTN